MTRGTTLRLLRGGKVIASGPVGSLKHLKDDVREVATGFEGGVTIDGHTDCQEGDIIEAYRSERVR